MAYSITLNGDPQVTGALADLEHRGRPVIGLNATIGPPDAIAATIASLVQHVLTEKSPV